MTAGSTTATLQPDRHFSPDPAQRDLARELYAGVRDLPLFCPHTHVPKGVLADLTAQLAHPVDAIVTGDHYVLRMLHSRGLDLGEFGVRGTPPSAHETDRRSIWRRFAAQFGLYRGTPTGSWIADLLVRVYGVTAPLNPDTADAIYDRLDDAAGDPGFTAGAIIERFGIELIATTDPAADPLDDHPATSELRPTLRTDAIANAADPAWRETVERLGEHTGVEVVDYGSLVQAIEARRIQFRAAGAVAVDHDVLVPYTERLSPGEANAIVAKALADSVDAADAARLSAHLIMELARMSADDGMVLQLRAGSSRAHNGPASRRYVGAIGADLPSVTEWTRNLRALLEERGNDPRLRLILFTLDESSYARELAPLAGHYPAVLLGAPWWFHDSPQGIRRYLDSVVETAGFANLAGFNDDAWSLPAIPVRHDVWRRVTCDWLAHSVLTGTIDADAAPALATDLAVGLARRAYRLEER